MQSGNAASSSAVAIPPRRADGSTMPAISTAGAPNA